MGPLAVNAGGSVVISGPPEQTSNKPRCLHTSTRHVQSPVNKQHGAEPRRNEPVRALVSCEQECSGGELRMHRSRVVPSWSRRTDRSRQRARWHEYMRVAANGQRGQHLCRASAPMVVRLDGSVR